VWNSMLHHTGNLLDLRVLVQGDSPAGPDRLWLTDLHVVPTSVPGSPPSSGR
jgi:hypothetical protein